jgi:hypothetical protein
MNTLKNEIEHSIKFSRTDEEKIRFTELQNAYDDIMVAEIDNQLRNDVVALIEQHYNNAVERCSLHGEIKE